MRRFLHYLLRITRLSRQYQSLREMAQLLGKLLVGARQFRRTGATPQDAYHSLILLFCRTQGRSNDMLHRFVRLARPPYPIAEADGVLGRLDRHRCRRIADDIRRDGYYIFPTPLSPALIQDLNRFARTTACFPRPALRSGPRSLLYNASALVAPRYDFSEESLMVAPAVQALVTDLSLLSVAQSYLGCAPVLDIVTMWWSAAFQKEASDEAGQRYHFDMDRIKWLKFFFYLSEVTTESGPTCFIKGSHRTGGQPKEMLKMGYARIADEELSRHYAPGDFVELTCPLGTIVAVDTRGFHKGKPIISGERLVLQLEYADSLFGAAYERTEIPSAADSPLAVMARRYPRVLSKFEARTESLPKTAASR